ncbi:hypothetical protein ScPMuIL_018933 [Solemya velum]
MKVAVVLKACCQTVCVRRHICGQLAACHSALQLHNERRPLYHSRKYSTSLAEQFKLATDSKQKQHLKTIFRTEETDPTKHTDVHEGLFYTVSSEDVKRLFQKSLPPIFNKQITTFQEACLMVREPALELFHYINHFNYNHPVPRFMLYGKRGSGKTMTLFHIIHHCAQKDWVIVHVPWPAFWLNHYKEVSVSAHSAHRVDLPYEASDWLQHFCTQNFDLLKDIKTTQTYKWTKRESAAEGTPLLELIDFGLNRVKFAADCVGALLREIRVQASDNKFRVLVAVECVNAFWKDTTIRTESRDFVPAEKLSLVHNFKKMLRSDWTNGIALCTVDVSINLLHERHTHTPHFLLGKKGFEFLDPFIPVLVPEYSDKEVFSCLEYYIDRKWIQNPKGKTDEGKKELIYLSDKNPHALNRMCAPW